MPSTLPAAIVSAIETDRQIPREFEALCDCGGRLTGTESERRALALLRTAGATATGSPPIVLPTSYEGWRWRHAALDLLTADGPVAVEVQPLVRSVGTALDGLQAEVLPLGRGTEADFAANAERLRGRIALVRHEYMFSSQHIHRRRKYAAALAAGASGFLIAGPLPAATVAGSCGRGREPGIPAFGISPESAERLVSADHNLARVKLTLLTDEAPASTETLLFDLPGGGDELIVLSAHLDGHDPAESAMDNASGVVVALAVMRALLPFRREFKRGLRLALFSAEEWGLTGSRNYLAGLTQQARDAIAINVNLDSVGGGASLTALCSDFPALANFVASTSAACGQSIATYLPLMSNSDHANFAAHGIPALRLVAGFDDPTSELRHVLTAADTRDRVDIAQLRRATLVAASLVWAALVAADLRCLRHAASR